MMIKLILFISCQHSILKVVQGTKRKVKSNIFGIYYLILLYFSVEEPFILMPPGNTIYIKNIKSDSSYFV